MWIFILVYALSPIPLLVLFIVSRVQLSKARREAKEDEIRHMQSEIESARDKENYRRYVSQLQNQIRSLDPEAKIGYLQTPSTSATAKPVPAPSSPPAPVITPAAPAQPAPHFQAQAIPQTAPAPAVSSQTPHPSPATEAPATSSVPSVPDSSDNSHTPVILTVGVILLLLASIGFISATWSFLGSGTRAIALLSFSAIFLGAGIIAKTRLHLPNTSLAFYSIGSASLPITIFGASAFGLLGGYFALHLPEIYNTLLLCFGSLLVLLFFGAVFFRSRVFATGSLISLSLCVYTLAVMFDYPCSTNILLIAIFASASVFAAPYIGKIPENSRLFPFSKVFLVYSILNLYVMTLVALFLSRNNIWSGVFLLVLSAAFFLASVLKRETGLLSLPSIVLLLVGTAQIVGLHSILTVSIWMLVAGVSFAALSFAPSFKKIFAQVLLVFGITFLIASALPIFIYSLEVDSWGYIALTLVPCLALTYLSVHYEKPLIFVGVITPCFDLLWITSVRLFSFTTLYAPDTLVDYIRIGKSDYMLAASTATLLGLIIAAALYGVFSFIPHHRFYTSTGNLLTFGYLVVFFESFVSTIEDPYAMWFFFLTLLFCAGCIVMGCRTDKLNYRDPSLEEEPKSITSNRIFYAAIWPVFIFFFFSLKLGREHDSIRVTTVALLLFAVITYLFMVIRIFKSGSGGRAFLDISSSTAKKVTMWAALITTLVLIFFIMIDVLITAKSEPFLFVVQHLVPLLIPLLFLILLLLEKDHSAPASATLTPMWYTLFGLISLTVVLPFTLSIPKAFGVSSFFLGYGFVFSILSLLPLLLFAISYLLSGEKKDPVPHALRSSRNQAVFLWSCAIGIWQFLAFMMRLLPHRYPFYPIALSLMLISLMILFFRYRPLLCAIAATVETLLFINFIDHYASENRWNLPVWAEILLFLLPVLIYCLISYLRSHTTEETRFRRDPFSLGALFSQILVFVVVPFMTISESEALRDSQISISKISHTSQILDHLFRGLFSVFYTCRFLFLVLPGFLLIELLLILRSRNKVDRRRGIALLIVTLSTLLWMPVLSLPSLSNLVEACYLIPTTLIIVLLPWLFPGIKEKSDIDSMRIVFSSIEMGILAFLTLATPKDNFCLILFGVISFLILLGGYALRKKGFLILGTVCVLGMAVYIINRVWGDMSWWIYLFVTGTILITIAVRNEIKKRK